MKDFTKEEIRMLTDFESVYSSLWDEYCTIEDYAEKNYDGGLR